MLTGAQLCGLWIFFVLHFGSSVRFSTMARHVDNDRRRCPREPLLKETSSILRTMSKKCGWNYDLHRCKCVRGNGRCLYIAGHSKHGNCCDCPPPRRSPLVGGCSCPCPPCQHRDRFGQLLLVENRKRESGQLRESDEHVEAAKGLGKNFT